MGGRQNQEGKLEQKTATYPQRKSDTRAVEDDTSKNSTAHDLNRALTEVAEEMDALQQSLDKKERMLSAS